MNPMLFICAFFVYSLVVYLLKRRLYPFGMEVEPLPLKQWRTGQEHALILSPDYWWARRFKYRLADSVLLDQRNELLKAYVIANNELNVIFSISLTALSLAVMQLGPGSSIFSFLSAVAFIRFLSRSYEIAYAFGCDVLQKEPSSTGLTKQERVRLALLSYFEIYVYSAAAYTVLPTVSNAFDALTLALNVGTLTNIGYAFLTRDTSFVVNLVFVQVIATLSLVVLSLAGYLSRDE